MTQYIDKSALVAEIEKWISGWTERLSTNPSNSSFFEGGIEVGKYILSFIDTPEVKEVDLEEEICTFFSKNPIPYEHITDWPLLKNCAIHFFELGLKAQKGEV